MTERIIRWIWRHVWTLIIALISFISGIGALQMYGRSITAILILIIVLVVAIVVILQLIDITEEKRE